MRTVLTVLTTFFVFKSSHAASDPRFWLEPIASYTFSGDYEQASITGKSSGFAGGLHVFGFFSQNLYLGVSTGFHALDIKELTTTATSIDGTLFHVGPMLGFFSSRFRIWATYQALDQWNQKTISSSSEVKNTFKGFGYSAGLSFWVWPHMAIGVEYFRHEFDEDDGGALASKLKLQTVNLNLSFPFEIFK